MDPSGSRGAVGGGAVGACCSLLPVLRLELCGTEDALVLRPFYHSSIGARAQFDERRGAFK